MSTTALFSIARICMQSKCPSTYEWIKKMWDIYIYISQRKLLSKLDFLDLKRGRGKERREAGKETERERIKPIL